MQDEVSVVIREAVPEDAAELLAVSRKIGAETDLLVMDQAGLDLPPELLAEGLDHLYNSRNNLLLVALLDDQIVGTASVKAEDSFRVEHIGEVGIAILREYWGFGLGSIMLEEVIYWAKESSLIRRLELAVQTRNERAIRLYRKFGFTEEAVMPRGAKTDAGEFLDAYLMSLMID